MNLLLCKVNRPYTRSTFFKRLSTIKSPHQWKVRVTRSWKNFVHICKREWVIIVLLECVSDNTELLAEMSVWFAFKAHVKHRTSKLNILDDGILEGRQKLISYLYTMDLLKKSQSWSGSWAALCINWWYRHARKYKNAHNPINNQDLCAFSHYTIETLINVKHLIMGSCYSASPFILEYPDYS